MKLIQRGVGIALFLALFANALGLSAQDDDPEPVNILGG